MYVLCPGGALQAKFVLKLLKTKIYKRNIKNKKNKKMQ